ncbi:MAG: TIGR00180 family glycosyltransferase [Humidesulfovibrio sp.]
MRPEISIVIPTHRRPLYLARALEHAARTRFPTFVVDSSDAPFALGPGQEDVTYRHLPGVPLLEKVRAVLPLVTTPFMIFCADDDFTVPRAALACAGFLAANPDYASAQGHYVTAMPQASGVELGLAYPDNARVRVDSDDPSERLRQLFSPYVQNFYAVHRTSTWREFYALPTDKVPHFCLLELLAAMLAAILGKHKVLPVFYSVRDRFLDEDRKNPLRRENLDVVSRDPAHAAEYETFLASLAGHLGARAGLPEAQARRNVQAAVELFIQNVLGASPRKPFHKKLPKYAGKVLNVLSGGRRKAAETRRQAAERAQEFQRFFSGFDAAAEAELDHIVQRIASCGRHLEKP